MTLDEARAAVGQKVLYHSAPDRVEEGCITSVNDWYVFVRYGADPASKATRPQDLRLLAEETRR